MKTAIWVGGAFLAAFALIAVVFFGWDVHKARSSLADAEQEVKQLLEQLRKNVAESKELREKLEQLGAQLEEFADPKPTDKPPTPGRQNVDLIREVISTSDFEWTSIGHIMKKTGLPHDDILREARSANDIEIGLVRGPKITFSEEGELTSQQLGKGNALFWIKVQTRQDEP